MPYLILVALLLALVFGPQLWAQHTFKRYSKNREDIPGTGAELARHLLDKLGMDEVSVEKTEQGDHYDPEQRSVRLSEGNHGGRSLTAIAVAAHEVGHAIQHHRGEPLLALRGRLVKAAHWAERIGAGAMFAIPVVALLTRAPSSGLLMFALGILSMGMATVVHLVTLPVEWNASFGKAKPIIEAGQYVSPNDLPAIDRILKAAAFTYVAASLASLLNLARWIAFLRR